MITLQGWISKKDNNNNMRFLPHYFTSKYKNYASISIIQIFSPLSVEGNCSLKHSTITPPFVELLCNYYKKIFIRSWKYVIRLINQNNDVCNASGVLRYFRSSSRHGGAKVNSQPVNIIRGEEKIYLYGINNKLILHKIAILNCEINFQIVTGTGLLELEPVIHYKRGGYKTFLFFFPNTFPKI